MTNDRTLDYLEQEIRILRAKLAMIDQKRFALLEEEGGLRTEMQHIENQIYRLRKIQKVS